MRSEHVIAGPAASCVSSSDEAVLKADELNMMRMRLDIEARDKAQLRALRGGGSQVAYIDFADRSLKVRTGGWG